MGARKISRADQRLLCELSTLGREEITARQLERWRQAGVVETQWSRGQGRGGSTSEYPPGTAEQVIAFADTLGHYGSIPIAVLVHFFNGHPVTDNGVRAAYDAVYRTVETYDIQRPAPPDTEPWDRAQHIAYSRSARQNRIFQQWRRGVRELPGRSESLHREIRNTTTTMIHTMQTGTEPSTDSVRSIAYAAGIGDLGDDAPDFAAALADLSIPSLRQAVKDASLVQLRQACADIRLLLASFQDPSATVATTPSDFTSVVLGPATILIRQILGPVADTFYRELSERVPQGEDSTD